MKRMLVLALCLMMIAVGAVAETHTVEELLAGMTLEEKVGQLFIIRPDSLDETLPVTTVYDSQAEGVSEITEAMKDTWARYPAGGIILFRKNLRDAEQLTAMTDAIHSLGGITPIITIDEEGGMIARIANSGLFDVPKYPNMQAIAETGDTDQAYAAGSGIGTYLKAFGIDATFAPVADVNTNPDNPVIGKRAFGDDPETAAEMVAAYLNGLHSTGTAGCVKHFPGHGDTTTDTHSGYAETNKTWEEMLACEMIPFRSGIEAGTDMVMVAHISAPAVTGDRTPATLSYTIVTEKLRQEMNYDGVVITDGMEMGAITDNYDCADAAVQAILAGVDIILLPQDYRAAFEGVLAAVQNGTITEERLDESVLRILKLKEGCGLL